jgi:hypothetical protein
MDVSGQHHAPIILSRGEGPSTHWTGDSMGPEPGLDAVKKKQEVLGRTNRLPSTIRHGHIENDASNNSSIVACIFVTAVTLLPSRCLAMIGGFVPSRCLATIEGYTYRHTDWWEGFFNQAVEMGSGAVIYVPSFIKIGSGIQKLIGGRVHRHTYTYSNVIS